MSLGLVAMAALVQLVGAVRFGSNSCDGAVGRMNLLLGSNSCGGAAGRCRLVWWPWLRWCSWSVPLGLAAIATLVQLAGAARFGGLATLVQLVGAARFGSNRCDGVAGRLNLLFGSRKQMKFLPASGNG